MIQDRDIVCFCNDWDGDPLSKKHIMRRLARTNRVLWVNSLGNRNPTATVKDFRRIVQKLRALFKGRRQVADNIFVVTPIAIPFHGNAVARWINQRLLVWHLRREMRELAFKNTITWTFLPTSVDVVGRLGESMLVYHCTDEFSEFTGSGRNSILGMEQRLIEKSHRVIVSAERLYKSKAPLHPSTHLVRHGVDIEHFRKACDARTEIPSDIGSVPRPIVGFFGLIADWVDLRLIADLARARPQMSFVLIGKIDTDIAPVVGVSNVYLLGQKPYKDLPGYCRAFDIAILPFVVNELTLNANPLKIREYLAAGLPVVSTAIPEVEVLGPLVRIGSNSDEFLHHLDTLVASKNIGPRFTVSQEMDGESWDEKVEEMSRVVTGESRGEKFHIPVMSGA